MLLYECLTCDSPYKGGSSLELVVRTNEGHFEPLLAKRPDCPAWLVKAIERCLLPHPKDRFEDGHALARELESPTVPTSWRPYAAAAVALALLVGGGVVAVGTRRSASPPHAAPSASPSPVVLKPTPSPTPSPSPSPSPVRPAPPPICHSFAETAETRLVGLMGGYSLGHASMIQTVLLSRDAKTALSAGLNGTVRTWDLATGDQISGFDTRPAGGGQAIVACFTPDEQGIIASEEDGSVALHDGSTGKELARLRSTEKEVVSQLTLTPNGRSIITGVSGKGTRLIDLATFTVRATYPFSSVSFAPDGRTGMGAQGTTVGLFDVETGKTTRRLGAHDKEVQVTVFSPDGKRAISTGADGQVFLWDLTEGGERRSLDGHTDRVTSASFTRDGKRALTGSFDGTARLWDLETCREIQTLRGHFGWVSAAHVSADGTRALTGGNDGTVRLWDLETGRELLPRAGHSTYVTGLAAVGDSRALSTSFDATVRLWDLTSGKELSRLDAGSMLFSIAVTPDGTRAIAGGGTGHPGEVVLDDWDFPAGTLREHLHPPTVLVTALAVSPDGTRLAMGSREDARTGSITLVDLTGTTPRASVLGARAHGGVTGVAFFPGGQLLTGGLDGRLRVWEAGRVEAEASDDLGVTGGPVAAVAASPDGQTALVGREDGSIALVDVGSKRPLHTIAAGRAPMTAVAFTADGRRAISGSLDGTIRFFDVDSGRETDRIDLAAVQDMPRSFALAGGGKVPACRNQTRRRAPIRADREALRSLVSRGFVTTVEPAFWTVCAGASGGGFPAVGPPARRSRRSR